MVDNSSLNLNENQKKIQMLREMKKEIDELEYDKEHIKLVNFKIKMLRSQKLFLRIMKRMTPYIAVAGASFIVLKSLNHTPFYLDDIKRKLEIKKEFDSKGNIRYEMQYEPFNEESIIKIYGKWHQGEDGFYQREVKSYYADMVDIKRITNIIDNNTLTIGAILGEPYIIQTEKRNNLTYEEINYSEFVQAITYSTDDNDYIIVKEKPIDDKSSIMCWLAINLMMDFWLYFIINKKNKESLSLFYRKLKKDYPNINLDELEKLIEIKMDNYKRLMR